MWIAECEMKYQKDIQPRTPLSELPDRMWNLNDYFGMGIWETETFGRI
jgi:hypothetical protein